MRKSIYTPAIVAFAVGGLTAGAMAIEGGTPTPDKDRPPISMTSSSLKSHVAAMEAELAKMEATRDRMNGHIRDMKERIAKIQDELDKLVK